MIQVSIIIPHYNRSGIIAKTLNSVLDQTYTNWEAIIVDDRSEKKEYQKLLSITDDKRIKVIQNLTDLKGPSICRNIGVGEAHGKYLLFLDSDDLLAPFCLEQRIREMEANPEIKFVVFPMLGFTGDIPKEGLLFNKYYETTLEYIGSFMSGSFPWAICSPIWKAEFINELGGFNEKMALLEDPELHIRALKLCNGLYKVASYESPDCYYRLDTPSNTKGSHNYTKNFIENNIIFLENNLNLINDKKFSAYDKMYLNKSVRECIIRQIKNLTTKDKQVVNEFYNRLVNLAKKNKLFTEYEHVRLFLARECFISNNKLVKLLRLKGLSYKFLLPEY